MAKRLQESNGGFAREDSMSLQKISMRGSTQSAASLSIPHFSPQVPEFPGGKIFRLSVLSCRDLPIFSGPRDLSNNRLVPMSIVMPAE